MPVEENKIHQLYFQIGDTRLPISSIQEYSESNNTKKENDNIPTAFNPSMSLSFSLKDYDVQDFVIHCLGIERKYLKGKYTKRVWHLIKYGKTKRVRHKNWKRSFGKRI